MAIRKRYKLFISGGALTDSEKTDTSLQLEDLSGGVDADDDAVFDLTVCDPSIVTFDNTDEIVLRLTRDELSELSAITRVLLGTPTSEDIVIAEGHDALHR